MREYLKNKREELQLTQLDVAKELCVSESYYSLIEKGSRQKKLGLDIAVKLSGVLGVEVDWIIEQEKGLIIEGT